MLERAAAKARTKDSSRALARLTETVDGEPRIVSDPPLIVPISELAGELDAAEIEREVRELVRGYRRTLQSDRRALLESYRYADLARKVVGVGSVGTRCWMVLMLGRDTSDPLVLQVKEAGPSVLEPYVRRSRVSNHGKRVVEGQRLMQAASDIFLGWIRNEHGLDGRARDFYVRQLWDWKTSVDLETIVPRGLELYAPLVRLDARARACALGRPRRDRRVPRQERHLRPRRRGVRERVRRPERRATTQRSPRPAGQAAPVVSRSRQGLRGERGERGDLVEHAVDRRARRPRAPGTQ